MKIHLSILWSLMQHCTLCTSWHCTFPQCTGHTAQCTMHRAHCTRMFICHPSKLAALRIRDTFALLHCFHQCTFYPCTLNIPVHYCTIFTTATLHYSLMEFPLQHCITTLHCWIFYPIVLSTIANPIIALGEHRDSIISYFIIATYPLSLESIVILSFVIS